MLIQTVAQRTTTRPTVQANHSQRSWVVLLGAVFIATGAVGLLLEQALEKLVATVIGASTPAAAVVLAVYFSGLAAGGALYARFGTRIGRPLAVYGVLEGLVGAWALFMRVFFDGIQAWSAAVVQSAGDSASALLVVRFLIACLWIIPPTVAMGASFPAIVGGLSRLPGAREARTTLAIFYTLNLVGAIVGTLGGAYWLLPLGGPGAALLCCCFLEVFVCTIALRLDGLAGSAIPPGPAARPSAEGRDVPSIVDSRTAVVLALGALSGFVFFAFEVAAVHLIGATVGTSAYAFADMLAAILVGMLVSGLLVGLVGRRTAVFSEVALGAVLAAGALALAITTMAWDDLPQLFLLVEPDSFATAEAYRFLFSGALLIPPAIALGGIYPLLFRLAWFDEERREALAGLLVAANALGCFTGALASAFILIPRFGSQATLLGLAVLLGLGTALFAFVGSSTRGTRRALVIAAALSVVCAVAQPRWEWRGITSGANVHFNASYTLPGTDLLFVHEDVHGGVTSVVKNPGKPRVLLTNGKFQGDDGGQMPAQVGFALVPLIHLPRTGQALVIGLGTGHSAEVVADAGFTQVDIAEIAPGIVKAAREILGDLNGHVLDKPNVSLHLDDGRNFVLRTAKSYDLVTIEISSVWFAGATNLYAREFYQAVHDKIAVDGVLQQWVQLHHISTTELLATILTLRDVFEHVELYMVGGQGILLASKQGLEVREAAIARLQALPTMAEHMAVLERRSFGRIDDLPRWRLYDERAIDSLRDRFPDHVRNTDMNRFLEYTTPRYQIASGNKRENVRALLDLLPPDEAAARRAILLP